MTAILAKVLAVENQADQYRVFVRIGLAKYRGSFNTLTFGENKPSIGFCHEGRLELVYYKSRQLHRKIFVSSSPLLASPKIVSSDWITEFKCAKALSRKRCWGY